MSIDVVGYAVVVSTFLILFLMLFRVIKSSFDSWKEYRKKILLAKKK